MLSFARSDYDAVIIGGRCAGAATAMLLARAGARVLVIERDAYGADTISTHALMRTGVHLLERWGIGPAIRNTGTPPVRQTRFLYGPDEITIAVKPDAQVSALYAPRRTFLDRLLVDAAAEAGAIFLFNTTLETLTFDHIGGVRGVVMRNPDGTRWNVSCSMVIGADGRLSRVAELVGARTIQSRPERAATVFGYFTDVEDQGYQWSYRKDNATGAIPTNFGQHCLFASIPKSSYRTVFGRSLVDGLISQFRAHDSALADQVATARLVGNMHRFGGAPGHIRKAFGAGWALVGDAGYFKDPLTAHGITDALRDADLLTRALCTGTEEALTGYQATRDELSLPLFEVTAEIASFRWTEATIRDKHRRLNDAMKAEHAAIAQPMDGKLEIKANQIQRGYVPAKATNQTHTKYQDSMSPGESPGSVTDDPKVDPNVVAGKQFDAVVEGLPTCASAENPPKYPRESYWDDYNWRMNRTYTHYGRVEAGSSVETNPASRPGR